MKNQLVIISLFLKTGDKIVLGTISGNDDVKTKVKELKNRIKRYNEIVRSLAIKPVLIKITGLDLSKELADLVNNEISKEFDCDVHTSLRNTI